MRDRHALFDFCMNRRTERSLVLGNVLIKSEIVELIVPNYSTTYRDGPIDINGDHE